MNKKESSTALITGASSGIGAVFAQRLAARGCHLVLVARRANLLSELAEKLSSEYGVNVDTLPADLSDEGGIREVEQRIRSTPGLSFLVNNAGFGFSGRFDEIPIEQHLAMLDVHVTATIRLTHAALPGMLALRQGCVINVSSVAAFTPYFSGPSYSPSKAYLNAFSEALQTELGGTGVRIQALCPGFTHTGFHDTPELMKMKKAMPGFMWMSAEQVVDGSLRAIQRRGGIYIPGLLYRMVAVLSHTGILGLGARLGGAAYLRNRKSA